MTIRCYDGSNIKHKKEAKTKRNLRKDNPLRRCFSRFQAGWNWVCFCCTALKHPLLWVRGAVVPCCNWANEGDTEDTRGRTIRKVEEECMVKVWGGGLYAETAQDIFSAAMHCEITERTKRPPKVEWAGKRRMKLWRSHAQRRATRQRQSILRAYVHPLMRWSLRETQQVCGATQKTAVCPAHKFLIREYHNRHPFFIFIYMMVNIYLLFVRAQVVQVKHFSSVLNLAP